MNNQQLFDRFTKQYSLSKTLRFELVPVDLTKKLLKKNGEEKNLLQYYLEKDKQLEKDYEIIKHLIDEYHKYFIEKSLNLQHDVTTEENEEEEENTAAEKSFSLSRDDLNEFENLFMKDSKDDSDNKRINKLKADLRKKIFEQFTKQPEYNKLDSKELLKAESLLDIVEKKGSIGELNESNLNDEKIDAVFTLEEIKNVLDDWAIKQKKEKGDSDKKEELKKRLLMEIKIRAFNNELKERVKQECKNIKEDDWEKNLKEILRNANVKKKIDEHPKKTGKPEKKLREALFGLSGIIPAWLNEVGVKSTVFQKLKKNSVIKDDEELIQAIKTFQGGFFTYLRPFCENRKNNIYTEEFKSTGVAKRIIDDNLPKFLFNKKVFEKFKVFFDKEENNLKSQLNGQLKFTSLSEFFTVAGFNKVLIQNDHKLPRENGIDAYNLLISGKKPENDKPQIKGLNQLINEHNQNADKENKIPKLKKLFKLPLCDSESASFTFKPLESDKVALIAVKDFYEKIICNNEEFDSKPVDVLKQLKTTLGSISSSNKIFIKRTMFSSISVRIFDKEGIENKWNIINQALENYYRDEKIEGGPYCELSAIITQIGELKAKKKEISPANEGEPKPEELDALKKLGKEITRLNDQKKKFEDYCTAENGMSKWLRTKKHFSIQAIEAALKIYKDKEGLDEKIKNCISDNPICDYFKTLGKLNGEEKNLFEKINEKYEKVKDLLNNAEKMSEEERLKQDDKVKIKLFLECFNKKFENINEDELSLLQFIKPLAIDADVEDFDNEFYEGKTKNTGRECGFTELYEQLAHGNNTVPGIVPLYNKVRSRFQKQDYTANAIRLCFDKGTLAGGWTESNENTQYFTYLFRKENKEYNEKYNITDESRKEYDYFLGISHDTGLFSCNWSLKLEEQTGDEWSEYQRLNYYQLNPTKQNNILKEFLKNFAKNNNDLENKISEHFKEKYTTVITCAKALKDEFQLQFENLKSKAQLKAEIFSYLPVGPKSILYANSYLENVKDFQTLFNDLCKKEFKYLRVNENEFENTITRDEHPLLLFKITNKDLSYAQHHLSANRNCDKNGKERKPREEFNENLHTLYFRHLMSGNQSAIDLGTAMLFFRPASIEREITHTKGKPIKNKRWELLNEEDKKNFKEESTFTYDLIKNRRFTYEKDKNEGKYFLHLSTQINYLSGIDSDKVNMNKNVLEWLRNQKENNDFRIIGIDRGERHLLYVSVLNREGTIQKQFSLNMPEAEESKFKTDYKKLLDKSSDKKKENQRNWDEAVVIDGLKKGYLSHVIHRICKEILKDGKPNAIIVLEHLYRGFMQQRPIDNSVYAKFEEMLVKKLNWLTTKNKNINPTDAGGVLNGWQLTEEYSVKNIDSKKQNGIIFYVPAKYTSKIDPISGFVNFFSYSKMPFESAERARDFFNRFTDIKYQNGAFEFEFDYDQFKTKNENVKPKKTDKKRERDNGYLYLTNDVDGEMKWTLRTNNSMRYIRDSKANNGRGGQKPINVFAYDDAVKKDDALKAKIEGMAGNINEQLKYLLKEIGNIDYENTDIRKALQSIELNADFYKKLLKLFFSAVTLRQNNGKTGEQEEDVISSLVVKKGNEKVRDSGTLKPENADANGAYHIALKGKWYLDRIDIFETLREEAKKNKKGFPSTEEWLKFAQKQ